MKKMTIGYIFLLGALMCTGTLFSQNTQPLEEEILMEEPILAGGGCRQSFAELIKEDCYRKMSLRYRKLINPRAPGFLKSIRKNRYVQALHSDEEGLLMINSWFDKKSSEGIRYISYYPRKIEQASILNLPVVTPAVFYKTRKPYFSLHPELYRKLETQDKEYADTLLTLLNANFHAVYAMNFTQIDKKTIKGVELTGKILVAPELSFSTDSSEFYRLSESQKKLYQLFGYLTKIYFETPEALNFPDGGRKWTEGNRGVVPCSVGTRLVGLIATTLPSHLLPKEHYYAIQQAVIHLERTGRENIVKHQMEALDILLEDNSLESGQESSQSGLTLRQQAVLEIDRSARFAFGNIMDYSTIMKRVATDPAEAAAMVEMARWDGDRKGKWFFRGYVKNLEEMDPFEDNSRSAWSEKAQRGGLHPRAVRR